MKTSILVRAAVLMTGMALGCRTVVAGTNDVVIDGNLVVSNNFTGYGHGSITSNLTVGGTISQGGSSLDSVYVNVSGDTMTGGLTVPFLTNSGTYSSGNGRMALGSGVSVGSITSTAYGAQQSGANGGAMTIGGNACGAAQRGVNNSANCTMRINPDNHAAQQNLLVYGGGTAVLSNGCFGAMQLGDVEGTAAVATMGNNSYGAIQAGYVWAGTTHIGSWGVGCLQMGMNSSGRMIMPGPQGAMQLGVVTSAGATNQGCGSIQLLNLSSGQSALMTGNASLGLGACTVTNDAAIVAGDSQVSHGNGTISAAGFYGSGAGLTDLNVSSDTNFLRITGGTVTGPVALQTNLSVSGVTTLAYIPCQGDISMGVYTNQSP